MGENSEISWTHHTFNPWWGCTRLSPACVNCYAETFAHRHGTEWGPLAPRKMMSDGYWKEPLKWNRKAEAAGVRQRVFCASMADVFELLHPKNPSVDQVEEMRARLFRLIEATPNLDWLLLTKRPENIMPLVPLEWTLDMPDNVWLGFTAESQEWFDQRWQSMRLACERLSPTVCFISAEPLLGELDLWPYLAWVNNKVDRNPMRPKGWVIAGGESAGPAERAPRLEWLRELRNQCRLHDVSFHFKQWGDYVHIKTSAQDKVVRYGKKAAGRELDGQVWDEFPIVKVSR